ncbi:uncharacterized protein ACHE_50936A [Aspergillus chevalieri]|uniref:Uncharacterized protein n=1 Tax=Aspergillus chevalieri TaxID=182096 RepID=A0A7R7VT89_ASPCH|nr:uncharacterized protein ACHE_50936A [Aspergillus chevalieri]BCR89738.1 hypothetical protein ACHE_50936A [Aspergillus chevalieri]
MQKQAQSSKQYNNTERGLYLSSTSINTNQKHSSRPKSPTPSDISTSTTLVNLPRMTQRSASPVQMSPRSSFSSLSRSDSHSRKHVRHSRKTSDDYRRYNGTVNHYGRHSNDWLFGGFSLRDTVRGGVERLRHHNHHGNEG